MSLIIDATDIWRYNYVTARTVTEGRYASIGRGYDVQFDGRQKGNLYVSPRTRFRDIYIARDAIC